MKTLKIAFATLFLFCGALSFESCRKDTNRSSTYVAPPSRNALTFTVKTASDRTVARALIRMADSRASNSVGNYTISGRTDEFGKVTFVNLAAEKYYYYRVDATISRQPYFASGMAMTKTGENENINVIVLPKWESPLTDSLDK